jgi:cytochrome c biogenesis protein
MWKLFRSLKLAILLASAATFLLMGGSLLFPGFPAIFGTLDQMPLGRWLSTVAIKFPELSWWFYGFLLAMLLLLINTSCCFLDWLMHLRTGWRKSGEYFIHLGVILLVIGFGWGALGGWRHIALPCTIGELTPLPRWPGHYIMVDSFNPVLAENGRPHDMISQIRLLSGDQQLLAGEVRINQPLLAKGLVITTAGFGQTPVGFKFQMGTETIVLKKGTRQLLRHGSWLEVLRFLPDARMDPQGQMEYRSDRLGNPALEIRLIGQSGQIWRGWYFLTQAPPGGLKALQLRPLEPVYTPFSSLTVNFDPGIQVSAVGGILVATGCVLALFSFYRKRQQRDRPEV